MENYFDNFPLAQYGDKNEIGRKLTSRANIAQEVVKNIAAFYPYDIKQGERPDTLSFLYYGKPNLEWLIFFANDIIDPYYDWYLPEVQFNSFIVSKYGSIAKAQTRTRHYEVSWIGDDSKLTISAYDALTANSSVNLKKYWEPIVDDMDHTIAYKRKRLEITTTTNRVVELSVANTAGTFEQGEIVYQANNGVITSSGSVITSNSSIVIVQHVDGTFPNTMHITGADSAATANVRDVNAIKQNIPTQELGYWNSVSYYEYEQQQNESKKTLKLISSEFASLAESNLKSVMI